MLVFQDYRRWAVWLPRQVWQTGWGNGDHVHASGSWRTLSPSREEHCSSWPQGRLEFLSFSVTGFWTFSLVRVSTDCSRCFHTYSADCQDHYRYRFLLHFAWGIAEAKCILVVAVCVSVCLSVCLSLVFPHYCTDPDVTWGNGNGYPVVVQYWADLQLVHGFCCYDNIALNTKCQWVLVVALCLVIVIVAAWYAETYHLLFVFLSVTCICFTVA